MRTLLTILAIIAVWFTYINWRISENFAASMHECRRIIQEAQTEFVHEMDARAVLEREAAHRVGEQMQQQALNRYEREPIPCSRARGEIRRYSAEGFSRSVLRSDKILLQNCAILRNVLRKRNYELPSVSNDVQRSETLPNSLGLNYKSAALNQLSYAGVLHTKAVFSELIKSSS